MKKAEPSRVPAILFLLSACLGLVGRTILLSPRVPMWLDEVYTYYALYQDHFADLWQSLHTNVNATPPGYFLFMWGVTKILPLAPFTLRLFSSLACCGALILVWATLRRHTSFFVASAITGTVLLTSDLFLMHNSEARLYGFYLLTIAWAVYNYDVLCAEEPTARRLVLNGLSHAAALSVTYVAGLYCAAILAAFALRDRLLKTWRPKVYLSTVAGWTVMLLYLPFFLVQRVAPTFSGKLSLHGSVFHPFDPGIDVARTYFFLAALAVLLVLAALRRSHRQTPVQPAESPLHLAVLAVALLAVPWVILALSLSGIAPVMHLLPRYCVPTLIGLALLFGLLGRAVEHGLGLATAGSVPKLWVAVLEKTIVTLVLAALVSWPVIHTFFEGPRSLLDVPHPETSATPSFAKDAPVIAACDPHTYMVRCFYSKEDPRLFYVLPTRADVAVMRRFQKRLNPVFVDDFLAKYPRFVLVSDDPDLEWLEAVLRRRGGYVFEHERRSPQSKWLVVSRK